MIVLLMLVQITVFLLMVDPLFKKYAKVSSESRRRQLAAQTFMLFLNVRKDNKFCDIKSKNVDEFYHSHVGFDEKSIDAKRFEKICEKLSKAFAGKPGVVGHYIIHLLLLVDSLLDDYVPGWEEKLLEKWNELDQRRLNASKDSRNRRETKYQGIIQNMVV